MMRVKNMEITDPYLSQLHSDLQVVVQNVTEMLPRKYDYNELHYQNVMARELKASDAFGDYQVSTEVNIPYQLPCGFCFGYGRLDICLENREANQCVIIELKAGVSAKYPNLVKYRAQVDKYVRHYSTPCEKRGVVIIFNPSYTKQASRIII